LAFTKEDVMAALDTVNDPEIPGLSIVDLGLIYDLAIDGGKVGVTMTVTAPGCPMGQFMANMAKEAIEKIGGVEEAEVVVVFEPPWTPERMSDKAKKMLGFD
jgi:metal-sulfur cluster biosynthetic enzyme